MCSLIIVGRLTCVLLLSIAAIARADETEKEKVSELTTRHPQHRAGGERD